LGGHLWVVITEPSETLDKVIVVNLTSKKPHSDTTTILTQQHHKFIKHETVVNYSNARFFKHENIIKRAQDRLIEPRDSFDSDTVEKIQRGLLSSPRTPRDIRNFYTENYSD
jgi:hypothetical protein